MSSTPGTARLCGCLFLSLCGGAAASRQELSNVTQPELIGVWQEPQPSCLGLLSGCRSEGRGVVLCKKGRGRVRTQQGGWHGMGRLLFFPQC